MNLGQASFIIAIASVAAAVPVGAGALAAQPATPSGSIAAPAAPIVQTDLLWLGDEEGQRAAEKLAAFLRRAEIDGLLAGPQLAAAIEAALASKSPAADKLISDAWVTYVQRLKAPVQGVSYGDPALALQPPSAEQILGEAKQAPSLSAHVDEVATVNPLYSTLRSAAEVEGASGDSRVRVTLDRLRLIPASGRAIVIDVAAARLWMLEDGRPVDNMKVVIGRRKTPTPLLAGTIHYVTFNPYWNIPHDVARDTVAPLVIKRGTKYLKAARYVTADGFGREAGLVDPESLDWKAVAEGSAATYVRQLPGPNNMMGAIKFGFVNEHDIYLHDTPRRQLFAKEDRTYSMGCIRLEHADRLARWMLGREAAPDTDEPEQHVQVEKGVPVFVTSMTANVEDGKLAFAKDVYGLDPATEPQPPVEIADASNER